jgi:stage II sporulation protein AB (anti-sigma F factor)
MNQINEIKCTFLSLSQNESLARSIVSGFLLPLDPDVEELADLRCAVSEAVTNCIVHAYKNADDKNGAYIYLTSRLYSDREIAVEVSENGCGIEDVERAREPMFTTGNREERCGMGFLVMESFTDSLTVKSTVGRGTTVLMRKKLK